MRTTLFLSFSELVWAFARADVTQEQLKRGLFYFRATPQLICRTLEFARQREPAVEANPQCFEPLQSAILEAEAEGRVEWRLNDESDRTLEQLNSLLARHGYGNVEEPPNPNLNPLRERIRFELAVRFAGPANNVDINVHPETPDEQLFLSYYKK